MYTSNVMEKEYKKKHLQYRRFKKKIDTSSIKNQGKKTFSVKKKKHLNQIEILIDQSNLDHLKNKIQEEKFRKKIYRATSHQSIY